MQQTAILRLLIVQSSSCDGVLELQTMQENTFRNRRLGRAGVRALVRLYC